MTIYRVSFEVFKEGIENNYQIFVFSSINKAMEFAAVKIGESCDSYRRHIRAKRLYFGIVRVDSLEESEGRFFYNETIATFVAHTKNGEPFEIVSKGFDDYGVIGYAESLRAL